MGKLKSIIICCLAIAFPFLAGSDTAVGDFISAAALVSAGADYQGNTFSEYDDTSLSDFSSSSDNSIQHSDNSVYFSQSSSHSTISLPETYTFPETQTHSENITVNNPISPISKHGEIITLNRSNFADTTDFSQYTTHSGSIVRYNFGRYTSASYINLTSTAQVRNCTEVLNSTLDKNSAVLPDIDIDISSPTVLIYHTHTTESFLPQSDWYDAEYPLRSNDPSRSIVAVGDAVCEALAARGVSVVHDCTVHDNPYTGAYDRSAETINSVLSQYPSIRLVIDIHRDGIGNGDGTLPAPIAEINGKSAAQIMIISGCENEFIKMPNYIENFKLACLIQNCAEEAYRTFTRPILFDYRHYNQSLSTGALLIEVGSHGNSLDEAVYAGELLGNALADAVFKLARY